MNTTPLAQRFHTKYIVHAESGCWLWSGRKNQNGYGLLWRDGRMVKAHRVALELRDGPIPEGLCALHKCDTPACVNPDHLFVGTKGDNAADRDRKGRGRPGMGERHGFAKLTEQAVRDIRAATGSHRAIAAQYGVDHSVVGRVKRGQRWKHVA